ncbi:peptidase inhibitor family I36 protein [Streptomyces sp. NPDC046876]|uniref:peptidase inhibitor family I36 protein n=1 Tax=Streptomyces sp. NPDC046876 TaxID=3155616 RepID=UPI0033F7247D
MTRLGLGAAAVTGLITATATSASAATAFDIGYGTGSCPNGYVCLWSEGNFIQGKFVYDHEFGSVASNQNVGDMGKLARSSTGDKGMQDITSSVANNTGSRSTGTAAWNSKSDPGNDGPRFPAGSTTRSVPSSTADLSVEPRPLRFRGSAAVGHGVQGRVRTWSAGSSRAPQPHDSGPPG